MIDLAKLKQSAESTEGDRTVVTRRWLGQVLEELRECRAAAQAQTNRSSPS